MKNTDNPKKYSKMVRHTKILISVIFLSLVSIFALSTCIALLLSNAATKRQADASQSELDALENEGYYTTAQAQQLMDQAVSEAMKERLQVLLSSSPAKIQRLRSLSRKNRTLPVLMTFSQSLRSRLSPWRSNLRLLRYTLSTKRSLRLWM